MKAVGGGHTRRVKYKSTEQARVTHLQLNYACQHCTQTQNCVCAKGNINPNLIISDDANLILPLKMRDSTETFSLVACFRTKK